MKEYKLQGLTVTLKNRSLKTRKDTIDLFRDVQKHINEYAFDSKNALDNANESEKEFCKSNYDADLQIGLYTFFSDENNLKELFSKVLDGDIANINYAVNTDKDIDELIQFGVEVFNDFFISFRKEEPKPKKLKKG